MIDEIMTSQGGAGYLVGSQDTVLDAIVDGEEFLRVPTGERWKYAEDGAFRLPLASAASSGRPCAEPPSSQEAEALPDFSRVILFFPLDAKYSSHSLANNLFNSTLR